MKILAYDCEVSKDEIRICDPVDVVLESPQMKETVPLIVEWYRKNRRDLPWRKKYQCVPGVDLGDHASADQGGGSKALL